MLILTVVAVWSGLYQYQATEAAEVVQADVAALAASDANNHFLVLLLWFVPAIAGLWQPLWFRRVATGPMRAGRFDEQVLEPADNRELRSRASG